MIYFLAANIGQYSLHLNWFIHLSIIHVMM